jgi:hypothetical protein
MEIFIGFSAKISEFWGARANLTTDLYSRGQNLQKKSKVIHTAEPCTSKRFNATDELKELEELVRIETEQLEQ